MGDIMSDNRSRDTELEKRIDAYVKGRLTGQEAEKLWEELLQRPDYIELLETELTLKAMFDEEQQSEDKHSRKPGAAIYNLQHSWKWLAGAAAVAIVLLISIKLFSPERSPGEPVLTEIEIMDHLITAPVMRSDGLRQSTTDSLLNRGYQAAVSGDLSGAMEIYDKIIEQDDSPVTADAWLNKDILHFNKGAYEEAVPAFKAVLEIEPESPVKIEKAYWYLGNAYLHLGDVANARNAVQHVRDMKGLFEEPAASLFKVLDDHREE